MIPDEQNPPTVKSQQPTSLVEFFQESPLVGIELDLERDTDTGREEDLIRESPRA